MEQWKEDHCKCCPNCGRVIEKLDGCDHMHCGQDAHRAAGVRPSALAQQAPRRVCSAVEGPMKLRCLPRGAEGSPPR